MMIGKKEKSMFQATKVARFGPLRLRYRATTLAGSHRLTRARTVFTPGP
jgi:hypothetical protein